VEIWELAAREGVRDCIARYNAHGDAGRLQQMMDVFTEDAVMEMDGEAMQGRAAIAAKFAEAGRGFVAFTRAAGVPKGLPVVRHFTSTLHISVDSPTHARGTMYYAVLMFHGLDHWGRYEDDYECADGEWQISHRREWMDGATPNGFGWGHLIDLGKVSPRDTEDGVPVR
jgi:hypothetical protein